MSEEKPAFRWMCAICGKGIKKAPMLLDPERHAHFWCWRLDRQRTKWDQPEARFLGEAKALHRKAVDKAIRDGDRLA